MKARVSRAEAPLALAAVLGAGALWAMGLVAAGERLPQIALAPAVLAAAACASWVAFATLRATPRGLAALLVLVAFGLGVSFRVRDYGDTGIDLQNGIKLLAWLLIPCLALFHLHRILPYLREPAVLLASGFAAIAMASALWSPTPVYTGASALGLLSYLLLACLVTSVLSEDATLRVLLFSFAAFAVVALAAAVLLPQMAWLVPTGYVGSARLQGLSGHPNVLGEQMAVMITLAAIARRKRCIGRGTFLCCAVLGVVVLEATGSRTMLAAVLVTWLVVALRQRGALKLAALGAASIVCAFLLALAMGIDPVPATLLSSVSRSGSMWELVTLTGRTELWGIALELLGQKPLLGWGFNGTEAIFVANVGRAFYGDPVNAHSMYMQALASLGVAGALPLFALLALLFMRVVAKPDPARDQIVLLVLIIGIAEVAVAATPTALTLVFFIFVAREARRSAHRPTPEIRMPSHGSLSPETPR